MNYEEYETRFTEELDRLPDCSFNMEGGQVLAIVTLLQLALKHPECRYYEQQEAPQGLSVRFAREFVAAVRQHFEGFPVTQKVIDDGGVMDPPTRATQ